MRNNPIFESITGRQHLYNVYQYGHKHFVFITDNEYNYYHVFSLSIYTINEAIQVFEDIRKHNELLNLN